MLITVTLNPAVDKTAVIPHFQAGAVNRIVGLRVDAGGKGVNVSKVLAGLGVDNVATGICGGVAGRFILDSLTKLGVRTEFLYSAEETRTNLKIADPSGGTTDINEMGASVTAEQLQMFQDRLEALTHPGDLVVFAGSLPPGAPADLYAQFIVRCKEKGVRTFVDTSGEALRQAALAVPALLKPNVEELQQLTGVFAKTEDQICAVCKPLMDRGAEYIAVTRGGLGAGLITAGAAYAADALPVRVCSTVGSGDAFAAAMAACVQNGTDAAQTLASAMAAGAVNAMTAGTAVPDGAQIRLMAEQVHVRRIF